MIRMLPEGFFFDMVVRIGLTFIGMLLALGVIAAILYYNPGKRILRRRHQNPEQTNHEVE